jgi:hypothetical protein
MPNQMFTLEAGDTYSVDTYLDAVDLLGYSACAVYINVNNGSATPTDTVTITIQTCNEDSDDATDWVTVVPDDTVQFAAVTGTGGANPWKVVYNKKLSEIGRWVRAYINVNNGSWSVQVEIKGIASY